jgi:hypothetical protein
MEQDEERLTHLLSTTIKENIGVKWKPTRTSAGWGKKKVVDNPSERISALHIECATERLHKVRNKPSLWYSSHSKIFPDGTKMRLVPTFASVLSMNNKTKFASCSARQSALAAGLASAITRKMSTNLLLDNKDPSTGKSL